MRLSFRGSLVAFVTSALLLSGPLGAGAQTVAGTTVSGVATDAASGAPLANVSLTLRGPKTYSTTSGANGAYTISGVLPGVYRLTADRGGYQPQIQDAITIPPGTPTLTLNVPIAVQTLSSISTIGRVSSVPARLDYNTSAAATQTISAQTLVDQGQQQVVNILNEIPGVYTLAPAGGGNNASPGAIRYLSVRGALGYETGVLIDGHPVANGQYGDFVTSFLNSNSLDSIQITKGPGADVPQVINSIAGTVNFRTIQPTQSIQGRFSQGYESSEQGLATNMRFTGSTSNGKIGWALAYSAWGSNGPLWNYPVDIPLGYASCCVTSVNGIAISNQSYPTNTPATKLPGVYNQPYNNTTLVAGPLFLNSNYNNHSFVGKLRFNFSPETSITAAYMDGETYSDQNGNHLQELFSNFTPAAGYTGAQGGPAAGSTVPVGQYNSNSLLFPAYELDHEPMFNVEFNTAIKNDTILLRAYTQSIDRLQLSPDANVYDTLTTVLPVSGSFISTGGNTVVLNGAPALVSVGISPDEAAPCSTGGPSTGYCYTTYYESVEADHLNGYSFEYDHPFAGDSGDSLTLSYDYNKNSSHTYEFAGDPYLPDDSIPDGSYQDFQTISAKGIFHFGSHLTGTLSNYFTDYTQNTTQDYGATFQKNTSSRYDPRASLVYQFDPLTTLRFSAGGGVSYPYLKIGDTANGAIPTTYTLQPAGQINYVSVTLANPSILPETSWSYDLGLDKVFGRDRQSIVKGDVYVTNIFNQFLPVTAEDGLTAPICPSNYTKSADGSTCTSGATSIPAANIPIFASRTINLSNARLSGIELSVRRDPRRGFGYTVNGTLQRAYNYNIPSSIYCTTPVCPYPVANINLVPNQNTSTYPAYGSYTAAPNRQRVTTNSNLEQIPYSTGYAEVSWTGAKRSRISFGELYYGSNNSLDVPAFGVANATGRIGLFTGQTTLQVSVYNLFNIYSNPYSTIYAGIPINLVNNQIGLTNQNSIGPRTVNFSVTQFLGR